ncbi:MAG TPA: hypothetical protein ENN54_03460 [Thermoplasmatales archaeon]|nr:hypothetical protein [Candidatus Thermoplasmatota archaeon]HDS59333.1 hypothetical protein [Thermoplasmatales archaeon]
MTSKERPSDLQEQYCRYINWSAVALIFMVAAAGGLYAVWVLESITLGFVALLVIFAVVIGGTALGLKACIRRR